MGVQNTPRVRGVRREGEGVLTDNPGTMMFTVHGAAGGTGKHGSDACATGGTGGVWFSEALTQPLIWRVHFPPDNVSTAVAQDCFPFCFRMFFLFMEGAHPHCC